MDNETERVRSLVVEAVQAAAALMNTDEVRDQWDEPSALDSMTVGALCAHLVRAAGATIAYLDRTDAQATPDGEVLTPVTYFHAAVDAPIHDQIKTVSANEAVIGHTQMVEKCELLVDQLTQRLSTEPPSRLVGALGGRMLSLDDFCRTRLIEVLLHLDDLASSVGLSTPETDPDGLAIVVDIITGIARHTHGDRAVLHALARTERSNTQIFPVF